MVGDFAWRSRRLRVDGKSEPSAYMYSTLLVLNLTCVLLASNYCYMPFDTGMCLVLNIWTCKHVTRPTDCQKATDIPMDEEARLTANWYPS